VVLAIDCCEKQVNYLKHNSAIYSVNSQIDCIIADFLQIKTRKIECCVFLNPQTENPKEKFSLFKHVSPGFIETLKKTLEISKNFVVLLPKNVDLEEIPKAFEGISR